MESTRGLMLKTILELISLESLNLKVSNRDFHKMMQIQQESQINSIRCKIVEQFDGDISHEPIEEEQ